MRKYLAAAWYVMRLAWRTSPLALVFTFGEVVTTILRFVQPAMVGLVVDGLVRRDATALLWGATGLIASLGFGGALEALAVGRQVKLISDIGYAFDLEVMQALSGIKTLDQLEQPRTVAAVAKVKDRADLLGFCFSGMISVITQATAPIASICVAVAVDPRLLILTLAGIPTILVTRTVTRQQDAADDQAQPYATRAGLWAQLMADSDAAAERKVFRLWDWYRGNLREAITRRDAAFLRPATVEAAGSFAAELFYLACAAGALLWIFDTSSHLSAGLVAAALLVSLDLKGTLGALRYALSGFGPSLRAAISLREVRAAAIDACSEQPADGEEVAMTGRRLVDASYAYPDADTRALKDINLTIRPGQVIAVVGVNGAGKSTLVEMILGLRAPAGGRAALSPATPAVLAQHFGRYQFVLSEAVALNDQADLGPAEVAAVRNHLEQVSPFRFWEEHDRGIAMQLGAQWPDGADLSGGQWQTVAAARCFYVEDADVVVLDEPTAALDAHAQEAMAAQYSAAARAVASRGGIAVLVSHRMSMPRLADHIIVLDDGEIVETGTHEELIALDGRYAKAYHTQASGFIEMTEAV